MAATAVSREDPEVGVPEGARRRGGGVGACQAVLQDDRQHRGADRAADALEDVQLRRRVGDLLGAQAR